MFDAKGPKNWHRQHRNMPRNLLLREEQKREQDREQQPAWSSRGH
jgi:hypothetical protein